jgi:hypothetical protein
VHTVAVGLSASLNTPVATGSYTLRTGPVVVTFHSSGGGADRRVGGTGPLFGAVRRILPFLCGLQGSTPNA